MNESFQIDQGSAAAAEEGKYVYCIIKSSCTT